MAFKALALVAVVALALAAPALAQPCIECRFCNTANCYQNCRPSCPPQPQPIIRPDQVVVNGDACRNNGAWYGPTAARSACDTARRYCSGGRTASGPLRSSIGPTNLAQCANIALGACQQRANDAYSWGNPCRDALRSGYAQCSAQQFRQFYEGETRDLCYNNAKSVSGVNPGTNQWAQPNRPVQTAAQVIANQIIGSLGRRLRAAAA